MLLGEPGGQSKGTAGTTADCLGLSVSGPPSARLQEGDHGSPLLTDHFTRGHGGEGLRGGPKASENSRPVPRQQSQGPLGKLLQHPLHPISALLWPCLP